MNIKKAAFVIIIGLITISHSSVFAENSSNSKSDPVLVIAKIDLPGKDTLVRGDVPIFGKAYGRDFERYRVEYGEGPDPKEWVEIFASTSPQIEEVNIDELAIGDQTLHGNLATWSTGLSNYVYGEHPVDLNGIYTVKLSVFGKGGGKAEDRVTVEVGRVIPNVYGGKVESKDKKVALTVPEQAMDGPFKVFGIKSVIDKNVPIPEGYKLVGQVYVIRPQGESFTKDAVLEMNYLDADLKSPDEEKKLGIYTYEPRTSNWDYLAGVSDIEKNILRAPISNITPGVAYYCILAKVKPPHPPIIYKPYSPTPLESISVKGESDPNTRVEVFVNGQSQGKTESDKDTGIFNLSNILLNDGKNIIYSRATDLFGQVSLPSENVVCEVIQNSPQQIEYLKVMNQDFLSNRSKPLKLEDKLYIELKGKDASPNTIDAAEVKILSSISDPNGITIQLLETGYNTGIYRGIAAVSKESSPRERKIAVTQEKEMIIVVSETDPNKRDKIPFLDLVPPSAPRITSATHPSFVQDTFEDGLGSWSNRDREKGALLSIDDTAKESGYCLKLTNQNERGNFSSTVISKPFDAKEYPLISFDYKIPQDVKIDFLAKIEGRWYEIRFTDDPKRYRRLNIEEIGQVQGVIADSKWHTAQFNLYQMLKQKLGVFIVEELVMADWDEAGYMKLEYGKNKMGAVYFMDNFRISKPGFANSNVNFTFSAEDDISKDLEYSYCLDQNPDTLPDAKSEGRNNSVSYQNVSDGEWYFHVRAEDKAGNWGRANHYWIKIDTKGPIVNSAIPSDGSRSFPDKIIFNLTDGNGSGVNPETIKVKINDKIFRTAPPVLSYNPDYKTLTFSPSLAGIVFEDKEKVTVKLIEAEDFCGNSLNGTSRFSFIVDYSKKPKKLDSPRIYSLVSYNKETNLVLFCWETEDALSIKGYSFLIDQNQDTLPGDEVDSCTASKIYSNLEAGVWYFHIRYQDKAGVWSETVHYKIVVKDTKDKSVLLIDDFNAGEPPNKLGGKSYYFTNPKAGGECRADYNREEVGYSLALSYKVPGLKDYAGYWTSLEKADFRAYNSLIFWVKNADANKLIRVGLRDSNGIEPKVTLGGYLTGEFSNEWQKVAGLPQSILYHL